MTGLPFPLLYVPSRPARDLDKDLERADITKRIPGLGKVDFHACRVGYTTFHRGRRQREGGADAPRHSTPQLTLGLYARDRQENLGRLADTDGSNSARFRPSRCPTEPPFALPPDIETVPTRSELGLANLKTGGLTDADIEMLSMPPGLGLRRAVPALV